MATFTVIVSALENDNDPNLLEAFCKVNKVAFGLFLTSVVLSSLFAHPVTPTIWTYGRAEHAKPTLIENAVCLIERLSYSSTACCVIAFSDVESHRFRLCLQHIV